MHYVYSMEIWCQTLAGDAGNVTGSGGLRVSKTGKLQDKAKLDKFHVYAVVMCMLVIVAPPIVVGVWSIWHFC